MKGYFISVSNLFKCKKELLPGSGDDALCLQNRLKAGATLLSELRQELENYSAFFTLINQL
jgi:hypothetical protein